MKLRTIVASDAARAARAVSLSGGRIYGVNLIRALEEKYGFFESPTKIAELDLSQGVKFRHGFFEGFVVSLEILQNGVRAYSDGGTELCDRFIDDLIGWAGKNAGIEFEPTRDLRIYNSTVEIEMDGDFNIFFAKLNDVGDYIGLRNGAHGGQPNPYRGVALVMLGTLEKPAPNQFRLERLLDQPFDSKLYYSSAPLSTPDHLEVLERIEKVIS